ncbi:MAG: DegQ family serine endoprotease [Nitrospinota bacterium]
MAEAAKAAKEEAGGLPSLRRLAERLKPTVVNIRVVQKVRQSSLSGAWPFREEPFPDWFRRFFGDRPGRRFPREFRRQGLGSGFIYSRDGLLITNNHVVKGAEEIRVTLHDGRTFSAKVLGQDGKTDLALLKIKEKVDLEAVKFGDSDEVAAGDWVMAVGNPFGLGHTVTLGIVSGKGRSIGAGPYDNFIQTDASINPGNSGGPLFNLRGEVVGVNTAIMPSGQGIGFSIPINATRDIVASLSTKGYVSRAWLGVQIQNLTPELGKAFGLKKAQGALVVDVLPASPAERAGLKRGDVIVEFEGQEVESARTLPRMVASGPLKEKVKVRVLRGGESREIDVSLEEMKGQARPETPAETPAGFRLGIQVRPLSDADASQLGLGSKTGLRIVAVQPGSAAERGGLHSGDVILEVNGKPADKPETLRSDVVSADKDKGLLLLVRREGGNRYLVIRKG